MLCRRRVLNQSTHSIVANSMSSIVLIGPCRKGLLLETASVFQQSDCRLRKGVVVGVADASN